MKKLSYIMTFRFGDEIVYFDPAENTLICNSELDSKVKDVILEHIRKSVFPQVTDEDEEKLKSIYTA